MKLAFWRKEPWQRPEPPAAVTLHAIGFVRNGVVKPRPHGWDQVESTLELLPQHEPLLRGIEGYSHVIVTVYLDVAESAPSAPQTLKLASGREYGLLATRSQLRPNHLGVSAVHLLGHEGPRLRVRGLDAIDGTPILDIKPYLPEYDAHPGATIPS
ncbi:MAG TPA: SAM-dependent methyltransferase [Tepidiformaceae bacterium]|nr:SAM-dependent methyltransferase [Tepidiformaceae bacterium]